MYRGALGLSPALRALPGQVHRPAQVLVRGVGAAADQGRPQFHGIALGGRLGAQGRGGPGQVRGVGPHHLGDEGGEVHLQHLVEEPPGILLHLRIGGQLGPVGLGQVGQVAPAGAPQVVGHAAVEREDRGGGAQLGAHVGDGGLAGAADAGHPGAEVLQDLVGAALDRELAADVLDDVPWGRSSRPGSRSGGPPPAAAAAPPRPGPPSPRRRRPRPRPPASMPRPPALGVWLSVPDHQGAGGRRSSPGSPGG